MKYELTLFGVKDTSENIIRFISDKIRKVDLIVTVSDEVTKKNEISGFKGLDAVAAEYGIPVFKADSYSLKDEKTKAFFEENEFEIGICMGWQRLIPGYVLDRFPCGVFGFHGNAGYLPFGRGRSPLNWSIILGDTRFNLTLFRYDEKADSQNIFATEMFRLTVHDDIRTAQYKNMIASKNLIRKLLTAYEKNDIRIRTDSKDPDSWYEKRTAKDGKVDFKARTRDIYNLIRGVAAPFPGAFAYINEEADSQKITIWKAHPFDEILDFSAFAPGEIIDIFDGKPIVRTIDGSLLVDEYDFAGILNPGDILL